MKKEIKILFLAMREIKYDPQDLRAVIHIHMSNIISISNGELYYIILPDGREFAEKIDAIFTKYEPSPPMNHIKKISYQSSDIKMSDYKSGSVRLYIPKEYGVDRTHLTGTYYMNSVLPARSILAEIIIDGTESTIKNVSHTEGFSLTPIFGLDPSSEYRETKAFYELDSHGNNDIVSNCTIEQFMMLDEV